MVSAKGLSRSFGAVRALSGVSLEAGRGESVGIGGAAGSGRTTLLRILATLDRPTAGTAEIDGFDVVSRRDEVRRRVMFVGDRFPDPSPLRVDEHLEFVASARGVTSSRVALALTRGGLEAAARVHTLSPTMGRQLQLAAALMVAPPVILLDGGLDGIQDPWRRVFAEWLREVRAAGTAVVVTGTSAAELMPICQRVSHL
jgi:ABC-2 type transport system ATP-binding protein